ncbi:MAG TPA: DUF4350 domain-containing protein [Candidatus Angelobacter sp.]|nr:DUF4350 domain-containing protein [Candidatus Angelobacter sp.]
MKIERSDRRLLIWAGVFMLLVILALTFLSQEEEESGIPSTYSTQRAGAKAAFLLLQQSGYKVRRWEQSPSDLPSDPAHTVLVLASPFRAPTRDEKNALQTFVDRGGKILATGRTASNYLPRAETESELVPSPVAKEYQPQLLTPLTRGGAIQMSPTAYWKGPATSSLAHYSDDGRPIVVSYKAGLGEVIWWGASTPLTNTAIAKSGNMALLLNSLGNAGDVQIFWDEYFHGEQSSLIGYAGDPPLKFGLLQALLVFLALIFTFSRRNGPIHPLPQPSRLSPLEFVSTLGKLYRRANAVHSALAIPYARFRAQAARQLGINQDVPAADLARALKNRLRYKDDSLAGLLQQIESALHNPELQEAQALELVQQLNRHAQNLKLNPMERQETDLHANRVPGAHARTN